MAIVEVSITPIGTQNPSVSSYVAECHKVLGRYPEIEFQLTPMGTVMEGELPLIMKAIAEMHEIPFHMKAKRVSTLIKIDDRRDKKGTMKKKVDSVLSKQ